MMMNYLLSFTVVTLHTIYDYNRLELYQMFIQEEDDKEYESEVSESDVDYSDIDIDEDDEVKSDMEDDEPKRKKRGGVSTKAYKVT
jgi:hypothetical protein